MEKEDHPLSFESLRRLYLTKRDCLDKWFDRVFRKYIRQSSPGCKEPIYTLHFGNEEPWYVYHRLKLLLTHVMTDYLDPYNSFNEVYSFTHDEIVSNLVRLYKRRLEYRRRRKKYNWR